MKICTFFGHKDCPESIKDILTDNIEQLIETQDVVVFLVGSQGNFDGMVTNILYDLKSKYPCIQCYTVLHKLPPSTNYNYKLETIYPEGLENIPPKYAIDHRNRWMLKKSDIVLSYVRFPFGGAAKFVDIAKRQNKTVINLHTSE